MSKTTYYSMKNVNKRTLKITKDEIEKYQLQNGKAHIHDITIRNILMNKKEAVLLINNMLNLKGTKDELSVDDIELYNNRFVTKCFQNREADIIYKLKKKDIFILIEHQSTIDYNMPMRILEYKVEIIRQWLKNNKTNSKNYKLPLVKAIVIYTGEEKWDVAKAIEDVQLELGERKNDGFSSYISLDVNNYSDDEKLSIDGALFKIIMLDMAKTKEKLEEIYNKISKITLTKEEDEILQEYTNAVVEDTFTKEERDSLLNNYKKGGKNMLVETLKRELKIEREKARKDGLAEGLAEGRAKGRAEGRAEGRIVTLKSVVKAMLRENVDINSIKQWTKLTDLDIKKIKEELKK